MANWVSADRRITDKCCSKESFWLTIKALFSIKFPSNRPAAASCCVCNGLRRTCFYARSVLSTIAVCIRDRSAASLEWITVLSSLLIRPGRRTHGRRDRDCLLYGGGRLESVGAPPDPSTISSYRPTLLRRRSFDLATVASVRRLSSTVVSRAATFLLGRSPVSAGWIVAITPYNASSHRWSC